MLPISDPHCIVSETTEYMSSWKGVSEITLDIFRDEFSFQENESLGYIDRSTECKGS